MDFLLSPSHSLLGLRLHCALGAPISESEVTRWSNYPEARGTAVIIGNVALALLDARFRLASNEPSIIPHLPRSRRDQTSQAVVTAFR